MSAYRDTALVLRRRAELIKARAGLDDAMGDLHRVYARRWSRIVGGGVALTFVAALVGYLLSWPFVDHVARNDAATLLLLGGGVGGVVATILTRIAFSLATRRVFRRMAPLPEPTGRIAEDLAALEGASPWPAKETALRRLETASTMLPMIAISMLAPLTLHLGFATLMDGWKPESFSEWIAISGAIVGHAHIALAVTAALHARKLARSDVDAIAAMPTHKPWLTALGVAVLAASIPGIILLVVPPILTALTGFVFVPAMYLFMRHRLVSERTAMRVAELSCTGVRVDPAEAEMLVDRADPASEPELLGEPLAPAFEAERRLALPVPGE